MIWSRVTREVHRRHQQTPHYYILDENPYQYQVQRTGKVHCILKAGIKVKMFPELALRHWHFWMKARSQLESCMLQSKVWYGNKIIFVLLSSSVGNKSMEWKGRQKLKSSVLFTEWPHAFFIAQRTFHSWCVDSAIQSNWKIRLSIWNLYLKCKKQ